MKRNTTSLLAIAALLVTHASLAVACGDSSGEGDDPLTIEEYFQAIEGIWEDHQEQVAEANELLQDEAQDPDQARLGFTLLITSYRSALGEQEGIDPPPEARAAHEEFLSAGLAESEAGDGFAAILADAETWSDMHEAYNDFVDGGRATSQRFREACLALEGIGDEYGIHADLGCE